VGTHHSTTRFVYPEGANFFSEGSYLAHDFPPTRGRTHSVLIRPLAYSFPELAQADASRCMSPLYRQMVERFQAALQRGLVNPTSSYAFDERFGTIERLLVAQAAHHQHRPLRVLSVDWDHLLARAAGDEDRESLLGWRSELLHHDVALIVPRAPLARALCLAPSPGHGTR
jgi:hypothetical protein